MKNADNVKKSVSHSPSNASFRAVQNEAFLCAFTISRQVFLLLFRHTNLGKVYVLWQKYLGKVYEIRQKYLGKVYEIRQKYLGKVYKENIIFLSNKNLCLVED